MKLPALAMAAFFAAGIAVGLWCPAPHRASSSPWVFIEATVALVVLALGLLSLRLGRITVAATLSACAWTGLGFLSAAITRQPPSADFVLSQVERHQIDLRTPLRWHGTLRDEPTRLPWGWGIELDLRTVEFAGSTLPATGGLRLSYSPQPGDQPLPELHTEDTLWVLAQARLPQVCRDEGAFDRRAYLAQQGIDLIATLRAPDLIESVEHGRPTLHSRLARIRHRLRHEVDTLFADAPDEAGILRAMLLGDRSFVERGESVAFQKTGVFHVLVVAGLHVGAFAAFLYWVGRKLRFSVGRTALITLAILCAYVAVIEQRPPVLRAAWMAGVVIAGGYFFRRLDLLNSAAVAALVLLVADPLNLHDSSFQLSFLAIGCIAGLGLPWIDRTVQPYSKALRGWRDVTRDVAYPARIAQFRLDLRASANWLSARVPKPFAKILGGASVTGLAFTFRVWELFLLTVGLQIGMLPMLALDFHRVTLAGPVVNLIAVPLTSLIVPLGFLALLCGVIFHPLGALVALPLRLLTELLLDTVQWFADFRHWSYRVPGPPWLLIVAFFAAAIILALCFRYDSRGWRRCRLACAALTLVIAAVIASHPFAPKWAQGSLELSVLDVGQGDSLFLVSPKGHTLLIDGGGALAGYPGHEDHAGPDPGEDAVSPFLWSRGFQRLDIVALTHAHLDHAGGLLAILENFQVGALWLGRDVSSPVMSQLKEAARSRHIPVLHETRGNPFFWDGVQLQFLWPESSRSEIVSSPKNDDSLVLHLRYGDRAMLLPGDAEKQSENEIVARSAQGTLGADVLKIGHHGSKNSTTAVFLAQVQPRIAIISAGGDNPYGHPSAALLQRLRQANVRILRTDENGAIGVLTDGRDLRVSCFLACPDSSGIVQSVQRPSPEQ